MEHATSLNFADNPQPDAVIGLAISRPETAPKLRTKIQYQKTRSTIALDAGDLSGQIPAQAVETFKYLLKISKFFARNEIVLEGIEMLTGSGETEAIRQTYQALQRDIFEASRLLDMDPPRVALEKRRDHFDLRIYPAHR